MDRKETIKLFSLISNAYDMFDVNEEKVSLWDQMLKEQDLQRVLSNLADHIKVEKYPPSISDLIGERSVLSNDGYLDKTVVLRIEAMKEGALKYIPHDKAPDFIKQRREGK